MPIITPTPLVAHCRIHLHGTHPGTANSMVTLKLVSNDTAGNNLPPAFTSAKRVYSKWVASVMPELNAQWSVTRVNVRSYVIDTTGLGVEPLENATYTGAQVNGGAATTTNPPPAIALTVNALSTPQTPGGTELKGRLFMPGVVSEADIGTDGSVTQGRRTQVVAALNAFRVGIQIATTADEHSLRMVKATWRTNLPDPAVREFETITDFSALSYVTWIKSRRANHR